MSGISNCPTRHYPTVQRGPADLDVRLPFQHDALPIQREMIAILAITVSITTRSLTRLFSMIRAGAEAVTTPRWQQRQPRFSRLVTKTKYLAGSTSSCSLCS